MGLNTSNLCGPDNGRGYNMMTATGKPYWPMDPRPEDVRIEDIARHLSRICRFNGALKEGDGFWQTWRFLWFFRRRTYVGNKFEIYSVAQHAVLVCDHVEDPELKLSALLHDSSEAYCHDIIKPIKPSLGPAYAQLEHKNADTICDRFGLKRGAFEHDLIKAADYRAVLTERRDLLEPDSDVDWGTPDADPWPEKIVPLLPSAAYRLFMDRFNELYKGE